MIVPARIMLFSMAAGIGYTVAEYFNWPLFRYYLQGGFSLSEQAANTSHVIHWYGWIGTAVLAGLVAAALMPRAVLRRLPPDLVWMVLIATMLAVMVYEKRWFT